MTRQPKRSVAIVGTGRVGSALALTLARAGWPVRALWNRSPAAARALAERLASDEGRPSVKRSVAATAKAAELVLITTTDDAIPDVAAELAAGTGPDHVVFHTSGVKGADVLDVVAATGAAVGALHPLATVARPPASASDARRAFREVRWVLDGTPAVQPIAERMVRALGGRLLDVPRDGRAAYHAGAVVASNYVVALVAEACAILEQAGVDRDETLAALMPLVRGTVENLSAEAESGGSAAGALSGPVSRGDATSVGRHLQALGGAPERAALYRALGLRCLVLAREQGLDARLARRLERALGDGD